MRRRFYTSGKRTNRGGHKKGTAEGEKEEEKQVVGETKSHSGIPEQPKWEEREKQKKNKNKQQSGQQRKEKREQTAYVSACGHLASIHK